MSRTGLAGTPSRRLPRISSRAAMKASESSVRPSPLAPKSLTLTAQLPDETDPGVDAACGSRIVGCCGLGGVADFDSQPRVVAASATPAPPRRLRRLTFM